MAKQEDRCLICGRHDEDHHDFSPPEKGCVCKPGSWEGAVFVEFVCKTFEPQKADPERCTNCEHEKECHGTT